MKGKPGIEKTVGEDSKAAREELTRDQKKSVKALLKAVEAFDMSFPLKRKLLFSCRDYLRAAAELENDALNAKFESEDLSPKERLMFLPAAEKAILDELENLKTEALLQDDDLAFQCLHRIASESAKQLLTVTRMQLAKAAKIAMTQDAWPLPYGNDPVTKKAAEELIKQLKVGSCRPATTDPRNIYSESSEARKWVGFFVELIDAVRSKDEWCKQATKALYGKDDLVQKTVRGFKGLPDSTESEDDVVAYHRELITNLDVSLKFKAVLEIENPFYNQNTAKEFILATVALSPLKPEKEIVKAWAQIIRNTVKKIHDGFPEKNLKLRGMGLSLARGNSHVAPEGTRSYESNLSAGIFQRFESTLMSIAKR